MASIKKIKLVNLQVNTENYRFEEVLNQKEAIEKMIENQGEKLISLIEDILKYGLNPNDKIQVTTSKHDNAKYNVLEGNRRTVALKLLNMPDLIENEKFSSLKKKFKRLHEENKSNLINEVECTVYDDPKEAEHWIGVKHGYGVVGVATDNWDPYQKDRYKEKTTGRSSLVYQAIKLLQVSEGVPREVKDNLDKLNTSNLKRLLDDPSVRNMLGIEVHKGVLSSKIDEKEVIKGLSKIVLDVLDTNFRVKDIYTKLDREDYIKNFDGRSKPNLAVKSDSPWEFNGSSSSGQANEPLTTKTRANPRDRKKLIPKSCSLKISSPRINRMYHELQNLDVEKFANASAISLRVFVELSVDCYIEEHKLTTALSSAKSGKDFQQKVFTTASHLESKKLADPAICKGIRLEVKDSNSLLGVDTLHAYIHNHRLSPTPQNLVITWDNIQPFIEKVWANIK